MVEKISTRKGKTQRHWNRYNCVGPNSEPEPASRRVYAIRLALGDGWRTALPMADFAELLNGVSGGRYDSSIISRMESGERKLSLADITALAAVDPERRGKLWVGWGEEADEARAQPPATGDVIRVADRSDEAARDVLLHQQ